MNSLQIVINKEGYEIHDSEGSRSLVSNIRRMDEALEIFWELSGSHKHPPKSLVPEWEPWFVAPGVLAPELLQ
ncbi:MAG: hypothetical protein HQL67_03505 [Magnetococcales bacterium]|nr:hypothetical protein [Magnetococcales bacterium]